MDLLLFFRGESSPRKGTLDQPRKQAQFSRGLCARKEFRPAEHGELAGRNEATNLRSWGMKGK